MRYIAPDLTLLEMRRCALLPSIARTDFGFPWYGAARWRINTQRRRASSIKTATHVLPSAVNALSTLQRVRSFLHSRRKNTNNNHVLSAPCFSPYQNSSAVLYGSTSEQISRNTPNAMATVFSRSDSFRRGIVTVEKNCVTVYSKKTLFKKLSHFQKSTCHTVSSDRMFNDSLVACTTFGLM